MNKILLCYAILPSQLSFFYDEKTRDRIIVKSDTEVTPDDIKNRHIILLGNPKTNQLFAKINEELPIKVMDGNLEVGDKVLNDESIIFRYFIPNPLNKKKYLFVRGAINSEYFRYIIDVSMNMSREEYVVKVNKKDRYSGKFDKTKTQWVINKLGKTTFEDNLETKESEHFVFHYNKINDDVKNNIGGIIEEREKAYEVISNKFNINYNEKIDYYLFMSQKIKQCYVRWDDDFWLGNIYEVFDEEKNSIYYKQCIYSVLINKIGRPLSRATKLGLYGALYRYTNLVDVKIKDIAKSDKYIPLEYYNSYEVDPSFDINIYFAEMNSFVRYLIDKYSFDKYMEYYRANLSEEMDEALYSVYNKDLYELEGEWLDYIDSLEGGNGEE